MTPHKCPDCGKWLKNVSAKIRQWDDAIVEVRGNCKKHGTVEPTDWEYEDFGEAGQFMTGSEPAEKK